jgi:alpha-tubulin suppressor-like RCC1 family protein
VQLGVPATTTISPTAVQVNGLTSKVIKKIATGVAHSLAIDNDDKIWAWGYNAYSQLGDGTKNNSFGAIPAVNVNNLNGTATEISAGSSHSLAIINGSVYAWGYNFFGQLGNGDALKSETPLLTPQKVVMDLNNNALPAISKITAIGFHNIAVDNSGNVWTWGYNGYGQLGDRTTTNRSYAQKVVFP